MKKQFPHLILLLLMFLCCGCAMETAEPVQTTAPTTQNMESPVSLHATQPDADPEPTRPSEPQIHILPPYVNPSRIDDRNNPSFHILLRAEEGHTLTLNAITTQYSQNGQVVAETQYTGQNMKPFFRRTNTALTLPSMYVNLLIIDDTPKADFDRVIVTINTTTDDLDPENSVYHFSMYPQEVTAISMDQPISPSYVNNSGWNWIHTITNDTDHTLTLNQITYVEYLDGIPLYCNTDSASFYRQYHAEEIMTLQSGETGTFQNGISHDFLDFNQRETIFHYLDETGTFHYKSFWFDLDAAMTNDEFLSLPQGLEQRVGEVSFTDLGGQKLTDEYLKTMAESNVTLQQAAEEITTLLEALKFLSYRNFTFEDTNMLADQYNNIYWHYIDTAEAIYNRNRHDCGGGTRLLNYLLTGDYDDQGYVNQINSEAGHISNWFYENSQYYFIDWVSQELSSGSTDSYFFYVAVCQVKCNTSSKATS